MAKILLVEDDESLAHWIRQRLEFDKYIVEVVHTGEEALELLQTYEYDAILLDWGLPAMTGVEVCRQYRARGGKIPLLMLTGQNDIDHKETGLDSGADDYLTKPFHIRELSARIRALLRRLDDIAPNILKIGYIEMDSDKHRVTVDGVDVKLQAKEFLLLQFLMRHPDEVFSADALLERVCKSDSSTSSETIYTYVKTLRKKLVLPDGSSPIETVHGVGYKLVSPATAPDK